MRTFWEKYKIWIGGGVLFLLVALILYKPVMLEGKKLLGTDTLMFWSMEKERKDYLEKHGKETYWTNAVFGGMPTYLLGASYPADTPAKADRWLRFFPRPVDSLFLYFLGFLILMWVLGVRPLPALLGAFAFTLSTYLIIILQVGHYAKASAIAYFPWVLAGVLLVWKRKKYLPGFLLTAIGMALEVHAKHYQMTYYLGMAIIILGIIYLIDAVEKGQIKRFFLESLLLLGAAVLGVAMNWTSLQATREYIAESTRGKQILSTDVSGKPVEHKEGLDKEYITEYSYGILETFNLFIPGLTGGSNRERLDESSALYKAVKEMAGPKTAREFVSSVSLYWGKQPIVMAPAYIGAVVWLLALIGLFLMKGKFRLWLVITSVLVLMLSWGKNFPWLADFFIKYVPLYNKFRAVASIQVILELLVPIMAVWGTVLFFDPKIPKEKKLKALKWSAGILASVALFFMLLGGSLFDFTSPSDALYDQYGLTDALIADRKALMFADSLRSLLFVLAAAGVLWLGLQQKLADYWAISLLGLLVVLDLGGVAARYIHPEDFKTEREIARIFRPSPVDREIMRDTSYYRVINFARNPLTDGLTSYFHKNLGGYHAAKPRRIQDIFDFHIIPGVHMPVLNMYNVKYTIHPGEKGWQYRVNPEAFGPAWFADTLRRVADPDAEIRALADLTSATAVYSEDYPELEGFRPAVDSAAVVRLETYEPNRLVYRYSRKGDGFLVFAENWYPHGWHAYIDGKPAPVYRVNYSLRGMKVPGGTHTIEMRFDPEVVKKGTRIQIIATLVFLLVVAWGVFRWYRRRKAVEAQK
ncbi:MAG: YfhO family protein [Chlorobi bacterium]|nr:YfhO family protein [Chlorobiota bacterium]